MTAHRTPHTSHRTRSRRTRLAALCLAGAAGVAGAVGTAAVGVPAAAAADSGPRLLVWDGNGVVIRHDGRTRVTDRPTLAAVGDDDAVAYQTNPVRGSRPASVRVWTPTGDEAVSKPPRVRRQHLAGGGVIDGRDVALVGERIDASEPRTRLVAVDMAAVAAGQTGVRTRVVAGIRGPGRFTAAETLPDGDVVALRRSRGTTWLHRFSTERPHRVWARTVAVDGARVSLAAAGARVLLAEPVLQDGAWQQRLRRIDVADGSELGRRTVASDAAEPAACHDRVGPRKLLCSGEHGSYRLLVGGPRAGETALVRGSLGRGVGVLGL